MISKVLDYILYHVKSCFCASMHRACIQACVGVCVHACVHSCMLAFMQDVFIQVQCDAVIAR